MFIWSDDDDGDDNDDDDDDDNVGETIQMPIGSFSLPTVNTLAIIKLTSLQTIYFACTCWTTEPNLYFHFPKIYLENNPKKICILVS